MVKACIRHGDQVGKVSIVKILVSLFLFMQIAVSSLTAYAQADDTVCDRLDGVYGEFVQHGQVDYSGLQDQSQRLDALWSDLARQEVDSERKSEYLSHWINLYNLAVIRKVLSHYPIDSPLVVRGFFEQEDIQVGDRAYSLNQIENDLIRAVYPAEARIHFALVCAARGCPPLPSEAYRPEQLDAQLDRQTRSALNNRHFVRINDDSWEVTQLFEWYAGDFGKSEEERVDFIKSYRADSPRPPKKLQYIRYDWKLNQQ